MPRESYAAKCLLFCALLGALFLVLASLAAALVIIWIGVVVLTLYTSSMSALGAMFSVLRSGRESSEAEEAALE